MPIVGVHCRLHIMVKCASFIWLPARNLHVQDCQQLCPCAAIICMLDQTYCKTQMQRQTQVVVQAYTDASSLLFLQRFIVLDAACWRQTPAQVPQDVVLRMFKIHLQACRLILEDDRWHGSDNASTKFNFKADCYIHICIQQH